MRGLNQHGSLAFSESLALKAVSLLLALILWVTVLGFKREEMKKNVKVELLLPPGVVLTNKVPAHVVFTLTGPRVLLKEVERKDKYIRPDLRHLRESSVVLPVTELAETFVAELPAGVRVSDFYPQAIKLRLEEVVEKLVEVRPKFRGQVAEGQNQYVVKVNPHRIAVSGPKSFLDALDYVETEAIDVEGMKGTKESVVAVEVDGDQGFRLSRDKVVKVRVTIKGGK